MVNFLINLKFKTPGPIEEPAEETVAESKPIRRVLTTNRAPASVSKSKKSTPKQQETFKAELKKEELDQSNFAQVPESSISEPSGGSIGSGYRPVVSSGPSLAVNRNYPASVYVPPSSNAPSPSKTSATGALDSLSQAPDTFLNNAVSKKIVSGTTSPTATATNTTASSQSTATSSGAATQTNTCSASITGGSFSNPIGVTLSCTVNSTIKYCVGLDTGNGCCDPTVAATTYSSQIVIGPSNGNYCLSYYGVSSTAGTTSPYQNSYTINTTLPNLQVSHPKIYYQTTQLTPGSAFVTSTDFGKTGYGIGLINLMSHDPGPLAENLTCDQIVNNYVGLPLPTPSVILSLLDTSLDNPTIQIQIPYQLPQLEYGSNFITTYMENNNFVTPIYSCSTTNVTLSDFEYFQEELAFGDAGTNSVREFTGGLSAFGFFEDQSVVFRSPAGVTYNTQTNETIGYGLFGIFY